VTLQLKNKTRGRARMDHIYNPSYSGGRDQEDQGLETLSRKNPSQKRAGGVAQDIGPEFKPQYHKNLK
jgi:hypothetical protein